MYTSRPTPPKPTSSSTPRCAAPLACRCPILNSPPPARPDHNSPISTYHDQRYTPSPARTSATSPVPCPHTAPRPLRTSWCVRRESIAISRFSRPSSSRGARWARRGGARARRWDWILAIARVDCRGAHRLARGQMRGSRRASLGDAWWSFRGGVLCGAGARRGVARGGAGAGRRSWIVVASTDRAFGTLNGGVGRRATVGWRVRGV